MKDLHLQTQTALVVLSGGQDSTTCLAWAMDKFGSVETITYDYGQRHRNEIDAAELIARTVGVPWRLVSVGGLSGSALTDHSMKVLPTGGMDGLPTTFTPGRNAVFLATACGYAATRNIAHVVTGICQTDYSGYPDCREDFRVAMESAMALALGRAVYIHAPLMFLNKAQTVLLAQDLDAMDLVGMSQTCYQPMAYDGMRPFREGSLWEVPKGVDVKPPLACGECPACVIRHRGFAEAGVDDPTVYAC